jgi:hypothetical protein
MGIVNTQFQTITCDTCGKTATIEQTKEAVAAAVEENPWLKTNRITQTSQGRTFSHCSDECQLASVAAGFHNPEEKKKIVTAPSGATALAQAAAAARAQEEANKALRTGGPVTLHQS